MNAGLVYLLRKGPAATWRGVRRRFRGRRGAVLLLATLAILALMVVPQLLMYVHLHDRRHALEVEDQLSRVVPGVGLFLTARDADDQLRRFVPGVLLFLTLLSVSKAALYFRPAEIQFLFPAPISRRQLLVYQVVSRLRVHVLSALWMSLFLWPPAHIWPAVPLAAFLLLAFLQLTAQTSGLVLAVLDERVVKRVRRCGGLVLLGTAIAALVLVKILVRDVDLAAAAATVAESAPVRVLSSITRPFIEVYLARSVDQMLVWSAVALAILSALFGVLMILDIAYMEDALLQARRVQHALTRVRSGGVLAGAGPGKNRWRLPPFPRLGGAGPMAWRHCQEMTRHLGAVMVIGVIMLGTLAAVLVMLPHMQASGGTDDLLSMMMPLVVVLVVTPMLSASGAFDFRRDLDRMPLLKSLPMSGAALAAGQLLPTMLLLTFWELVGVLVIALATGRLPASIIAGVVLAIPPFSWFIAAVDNVLFLVWPTRLPVSDPGRLPFMGHMMIVMVLKSIAIGLLIGGGALAGVFVWVQLGRSPLLVGATVASFFAIAAWPLTHAVAAAFRSFDVTKSVAD